MKDFNCFVAACLRDAIPRLAARQRAMDERSDGLGQPVRGLQRQQHVIVPCILALLLAILLPGILPAQRGDIVIPTSASIAVPLGAQICADRVFANNPGYGTLNLADPSGLCAGAVITPVELLIFSALMQDGVVVLSWTTATETRNYGFEVQRKTEYGGWAALGFVEGHGSTTQAHAYEFTDRLADLPRASSVLRYRLRQIDLDGRYEYSPEVELRLDAPLPRFALTGYPSPCDEAYTLRLTLAEPAVTNIRLHDITGRMVMVIAHDATLQAGSHSMRIGTAKLPSGLYLLVADGAEGRRTEKVVIRH